MIAPCETISKNFLPALKLATAKKLEAKGVTQMVISRELGITQSQVSKYLSGKVAGEILELVSKQDFQDKAETIAEAISSKAELGVIHGHTCDFCESVNNHKCYLRLVV